MLTLPLIYLSISLIFGLVLIVMLHKLLSRIIINRFQLNPSTLTFNVLATGMVISSALLVSEATRPMVSLVSLLSQSHQDGWVMTSIVYIAGFYTLTIVSAFIIVFGSLIFFQRMTGNLNEAEELKNNNIGVAILLAAIMIAMTIFIKSPLVSVLEAIIPTPMFSN